MRGARRISCLWTDTTSDRVVLLVKAKLTVGEILAVNLFALISQVEIKEYIITLVEFGIKFGILLGHYGPHYSSISMSIKLAVIADYELQ